MWRVLYEIAEGLVMGWKYGDPPPKNDGQHDRSHNSRADRRQNRRDDRNRRTGRGEQPRNRKSGQYEEYPQDDEPTASGEGTPIPGRNCTQCGAPVVRTKTITAEDGSSGSMPGNGYFATPTCDCLADCSVPPVEEPAR